MMRPTAGSVLCLAALALRASASDPPTADLGYVTYTGFTNETAQINYFYGIPYAQPPLGHLRWRAPRPIEASNNFTGQIINATSPPPMCYQSATPLLVEESPAFGSFEPEYYFQNLPQSEDCLMLNVKAPQNPTSNSLPVFVMLHGGGYTVGSPEIVSPGDAIVHKSNGSLIYVEVQYRLGLFGFLAGSEVKESGDLNVGLLDQRAALDWLQRNIKAFGGDPNRVTIWGGSAGGGSVTLQLTAGGAFDQPPFSAAIPEYPWWIPMLTGSTQERQFRTALQLSNCSDLACLRALESSDLQFANQRVLNTTYPGPQYGAGSGYWGPVVDGKFIRQLPSDEFKQGNFHKVPILLDHDAYEGYIFSLPSATLDETIMDAMYEFPSAGPSFFSRLNQLYPQSAYNSTFFQRQTWFGDVMINCPTYYVATAFTDRAFNTSAVFKLIFAAGSQLHAATTPFLTSKSINFPDANNATLADIMSAYWISFATTHDPNPLRDPRAPFWPSYSSGGNGSAADGQSIGFSVLQINDKSIEVQGDPDNSAACSFFSSHSQSVLN
ncbi:alpha beta-hydrolase [Diplodia corticola]|uniref:Carboxylic ester hydrolase n=1 Tax=Diplodia corticola TaxID=236234 RepID=A0A1J9RSG4_9PEZI|nr:alpha beta-hydrolase [Diplodia corticola]OJD30820.1 alpha beta-hydrolase [Diplodia corticola]